MGPNLMTDVLMRRSLKSQTQRWGHLKTEAKTGAMRPQAKECLGSLEAGRGKAGSLQPPEPPEGADTLASDFWPP